MFVCRIQSMWYFRRSCVSLKRVKIWLSWLQKESNACEKRFDFRVKKYMECCKVVTNENHDVAMDVILSMCITWCNALFLEKLISKYLFIKSWFEFAMSLKLGWECPSIKEREEKLIMHTEKKDIWNKH